jgi:hypothetical protein
MDSREKIRPGMRYSFVCRDPQGRVKWTLKRSNLIPDEGANFQINQFYLGNPWYLGLIVTGDPFSSVFDSGDTAAKITSAAPNPPTTNGWQAEANVAPVRQLLTFTNTSPPGGFYTALSASVIFTYSGSGFFGGGYVVSSAMGATGTLYSEMQGDGSAYAGGDTVTATVEFDLVPPPQ